MKTIHVPHDALILVMDGSRALLLRNGGTPQAPALRVEQHVDAPANPLSHDQGSDRPGRTAMGSRRSSLQEPSPHERQEEAFVRAVGIWLDTFISQRGSGAGLVLIAPPRCLAILRRDMPATSRRHVLAEESKDLAGMPLETIEARLREG